MNRCCFEYKYGIKWIRTFYFPGWKAYIDSKKTTIKKESDTGAMLIDIPAGKHALVLKFEDIPLRYVSKFVSLAALFFVVILSFSSVKLREKINGRHKSKNARK